MSRSPGLVLLSLVDHLTELSVVQPVVPAGVELLKGDPDLLVSQVLADRHELLNRGIIIITMYCIMYYTAGYFLHEYLQNVWWENSKI